MREKKKRKGNEMKGKRRREKEMKGKRRKKYKKKRHKVYID